MPFGSSSCHDAERTRSRTWAGYRAGSRPEKSVLLRERPQGLPGFRAAITWIPGWSACRSRGTLKLALGGRSAQRKVRMSKQPRETVVVTACAWCNTVIGKSTSPWTGEKALTTHGLCSDCLRRFRPRVARGRPAPPFEKHPRERAEERTPEGASPDVNRRGWHQRSSVARSYSERTSSETPLLRASSSIGPIAARASASRFSARFSRATTAGSIRLGLPARFNSRP